MRKKGAEAEETPTALDGRPIDDGPLIALVDNGLLISLITAR